MAQNSNSVSRWVTLIAPGPSEEAQATWWRPISWKWPSFAPLPGLQVLDWNSTEDADITVTGSVVLVIPGPHEEAAGLYKLLDRLQEAMVPVVLLLSPDKQPLTPGRDDGVITLPDDTDPTILAVMLATLAERQDTIESLSTEVRVSRRFQSGLRGQIEQVHEELQLAASVQRDFMPRSLSLPPKLDMQVFFRPCGYVSGDIYDVQRLDHEHMGFFVADAVGHGVPAALMTMVLCRCLTTIEREDGQSRIVPPARALQMLNEDIIRRHGEGSRFATAVYGVINSRTREVRIAGAGHPYPLRIRGGNVQRVETEGGLLGIFAGDEFTENAFILEEDEMIVVYSDGFETAFPPAGADAYGRKLPNLNYIDRFSEMAASWRKSGLSAAMRQLAGQIDGQAGSLHQTDDLTALVVVPALQDPLERLFTGDIPGSAPREAPKGGSWMVV